MKRSVTFAADIARTVVGHPKWFATEAFRKLVEIRWQATGPFKHGLRKIYHHHLDSRLQRLPVELGGALGTAYSKAMLVARFCRLLQPAKVLEIGTFKGYMTFHIARNTPPECRIWTMDLPRHLLDGIKDDMYSWDAGLAAMDASNVGEEWQGRPESSKITQLWGDSLHFDFSGHGPFDLIYVDGSHAEPWVDKDTENAFRLLSPTGAILWDDCNWSDVQRVLGRYGKNHPIYLFEDGETAGYLQIDGVPVSLS